MWNAKTKFITVITASAILAGCTSSDMAGPEPSSPAAGDEITTTSADAASSETSSPAEPDPAASTSRPSQSEEQTDDASQGTEEEQQEAAQVIAMRYLTALEDVSTGVEDPAVLHTMVTSFGPESEMVIAYHDPPSYDQVGRATFEPFRTDRSSDDEFQVQVCVDTTGLTALMGPDGTDYLDTDRQRRVLETLTVRWHNSTWLIHETSSSGQSDC